ncbi:MAG: hypothetical protein K0U64_04895 [Actinomycetia bacterium]|nr:hypothetical protein [Actinomycetes bacterium]
MIILIGPKLIPLSDLPSTLGRQSPLLSANWNREYVLLSGRPGDLPERSKSLAAVVAERADKQQPTMLVGLSARSNKRIARLLRNFPEITAIRGLKPAEAILARQPMGHIPTTAEVARILGWPTAELTTAIPRRLNPLQVLALPEDSEALTRTDVARLVAESHPDIVVAPQEPDGTPGLAEWVAGTPYLRLAQWPPAETEVTPRPTLRRRLAELARVRPKTNSESARWAALVRDTKRSLHVPGTGKRTQASSGIGLTTESPNYELVIGSLNTAGQAYQWARAARDQGLRAVSNQYVRRNQKFVFAADINTTPQNSTLRRRLDVFEFLFKSQPVVLVESLSSFTNLPRVGGGPVQGLQQLQALSASGIPGGVVFHGSDVRRPSRYRGNHAFSPFGEGADQDFVSRLERQTALMESLLADYDGPTFVSTLDLIDDVPTAEWLPQVVDPNFFDTTALLAAPRTPPVVVHAPSHAGFKGSDIIDPILTELHESGIIHYRRIRGIRPSHMPAVLEQADIVVDQVLMNLCSATAAETMAAGRVVLANTTGFIADRYPSDLPTVHVDPTTLRETLVELAGEPERRQELGQAGRAYARKYHDGQYSGQVLANWVRETKEHAS